MGNFVWHFASRLQFFGVVLSVATVATFLLVACGGGGTTPGPTATSQPTTPSQPTPTATATTVKVQIIEQNGRYSFSPATLTLAKGTTVEWTNMSDAPHTVSSDTNAFSTISNLTQNQTFMFTFNMAGTFSYHCNIHPYMKAMITVTS